MDKVVPGAPDEVLLVLDGSTGQNAFEQAKQFMAATEINALAVTKLDGTAKGGVVIGISDQSFVNCYGAIKQFIENNSDFILNRLENDQEVSYVDVPSMTTNSANNAGNSKFKDIFDD